LVLLAHHLYLQELSPWVGCSLEKKAGSKGEEDPYEKANALLSEVVMNYKTIQSFGEDNIDTLFVKY
jgi:hypothetical protein